MLTRRSATGVLASQFLFGSQGRSLADDYPTRPIRIIIPGGPGGPNDLIARLAVEFLAPLGQPTIAENRPGGGGAIGARSVLDAAPDGHTLLVGNTGTLAVLPATVSDLGYDAATAFTPVTRFWESAQILVVSPRVPAAHLGELIALARTSPDSLTYAHAGQGGLPHLAVELFRARAGIDLLGIAYRSDAEAITAVLSDVVQLSIRT